MATDEKISELRKELDVMTLIAHALEPLPPRKRLEVLAAAAGMHGMYDLAIRALAAAREFPKELPLSDGDE